MSDYQKDAHAAADALVAALWPAVEELTDQKDTGALTALVTVARPYLRAALSRIEGIAPTVDRRMAAYVISAMFWDVENGEGEAELIGEAEAETVYGLQGALEKLGLWIAELHDDEELDQHADLEAITRRVPTLRSAVTRGGGTGAFRQYYHADGFKMLAHATVRRATEEDEDAG